MSATSVKSALCGASPNARPALSQPLPPLCVLPCVFPQTRVRALTYAMLAILGEHVIWLAAATEMSRRLLHAVVFAAAVADGTRMDGWERRRTQRTSVERHFEQHGDVADTFCDCDTRTRIKVAAALNRNQMRGQPRLSRRTLCLKAAGLVVCLFFLSNATKR